MRYEDVELAIPAGGTIKLVEITLVEEGGSGHSIRTVLTEEAFRKLMSEGEQILEHWSSPLLYPWKEG